MFKINATPTFTRPVTVRVPAGAGFTEETFTATFNVLPFSRTGQERLTSEAGTLEFLQEAIVRFDEIIDEAGAALPFSEQVRDAVLDRYDARAALITCYFAAIRELAPGN